MTEEADTRFACDAMLGGLARWLRAAGYDAWWRADVGDRELIEFARREGRVLLTSDTGIFQYGVIRDGVVASLMIPHRMSVQQQLAHVLGRLNLPARTPRCMACGGELAEVPKEQVRERVPPRNFAWLDRFWECRRCGQLFWQGSHWQRIAPQLEAAARPSTTGE